ncbi:hypothetical protein TWF173_002066 [Orbilia oligospora]|nr:hypothetical protein TWF173_002066 [Orbilia oligospora]
MFTIADEARWLSGRSKKIIQGSEDSELTKVNMAIRICAGNAGRFSRMKWETPSNHQERLKLLLPDDHPVIARRLTDEPDISLQSITLFRMSVLIHSYGVVVPTCAPKPPKTKKGCDRSAKQPISHLHYSVSQCDVCLLSKSKSGCLESKCDYSDEIFHFDDVKLNNIGEPTSKIEMEEESYKRLIGFYGEGVARSEYDSKVAPNLRSKPPPSPLAGTIYNSQLTERKMTGEVDGDEGDKLLSIPRGSYVLRTANQHSNPAKLPEALRSKTKVLGRRKGVTPDTKRLTKRKETGEDRMPPTLIRKRSKSNRASSSNYSSNESSGHESDDSSW